ncbi:MAG: RNA-directed DNA polymerase, partial [Betaproteobacteria bacterium]
KKTNVFRRGRRQMVTGLVVNDQVSVPRAVRRRLRAAVHQVEQGGQAHGDGLPQDLAALKGRLGFVAMVQNAQAQQAAKNEGQP